MSDRITAPFTEQQVAALNAFQRSGVMHPFTCGGVHDMHQTLVAEPDGWHCPDEECGYRQDWAWAFMAEPTFPAAVQRPGVAEYLTVMEAARSGSPMAAELKRVREELRTTQDQLAQLRRDATGLAARNSRLQERLEAAKARLQALHVHEAICRIEAAVPAPAAPVCGETLYSKPIDDVPTGGKL